MPETIQRREWRNDSPERAAWGVGPWQAEPDKVQWVDEETGFDCLLNRHPSRGHWCGYVGVSERHPLFGIDYSQCAQQPPCGESYCDHSPGSQLRVHGGITFADSCHEPTREQHARMIAALSNPKLLADVARYPHDDMARYLRRCRAAAEQTFEQWAESEMGQRVCHVPAAGRPERVWWFGFDCAHSGDVSPGAGRFGFGSDDSYKTRSYVEGEVRHLARQLANLRSASAD